MFWTKIPVFPKNPSQNDTGCKSAPVREFAYWFRLLVFIGMTELAWHMQAHFYLSGADVCLQKKTKTVCTPQNQTFNPGLGLHKRNGQPKIVSGGRHRAATLAPSLFSPALLMLLYPLWSLCVFVSLCAVCLQSHLCLVCAPLWGSKSNSPVMSFLHNLPSWYLCTVWLVLCLFSSLCMSSLLLLL